MLLGIPRPFELDPLPLTYPTGMLCDVAEVFMYFFFFFVLGGVRGGGERWLWAIISRHF